MPLPDPSKIPPSPEPAPYRHAVNILAGSAILALLYLGREILVPITLAGILSLVIAPLVRVFRRWRFGQVSAVLSSVALVTVLFAGVAFVIILQIMAMGQSLPDYEQTLRNKVQTVQAATLGRLKVMQGEVGKVMGQLADEPPSFPALSTGATPWPFKPGTALPVEIREPAPNAVALMSRLASSIWGPLGTAGIVLVTLIFALLEHESLRDRFIRLAGGGDLRAATHALNDAGERLSRYFMSQLSVNASVGAVVGVGLALVGVPQALLWATVTAILRFVPYVGVLLAAGSAALLAAAVEPGWSLCLMTLTLFMAVELLVSQVVEPLLYGHSTGMSPISVVLAAIFWSWLWGPVGLLLSTPLTLCLVVAGRNVQGLAFLDILFGDTPALTLSQRFYQRALAGDAHELIIDAQAYLLRKTLASYCDEVLVPALHLAGADMAMGLISPEQQLNVRSAVVSLLGKIGPDAPGPGKRRECKTVLDQASLGTMLRRQREATLGQWQGPLEVPAGSIALCIGLGSLRDDLDTEILVRVLRDEGIDARHSSAANLIDPPPNAKPESVAMVFIVSMQAVQDLERRAALAAQVRERLAGVPIVEVLPASEQREPVNQGADVTARSFTDAVAHAGLRFTLKGQQGKRH